MCRDSSVQGLPTIRAYGAEAAFQSSFISHLSLNGSWWFAYLASSRWIGFRLDLIATITLTLAVLLATAVRQQVRCLALSTHSYTFNPANPNLKLQPSLWTWRASGSG